MIKATTGYGSLLWLLQKEEAAVQLVIRLEECSVKRYRSHILFTAREAKYTFWVFWVFDIDIGWPQGTERQAH